jgi:hypothetical protein
MSPKSQQSHHKITGQGPTGETLEKSKEHFRALFNANNLSVNVQDDYPSSVETTEALLNGDMDTAWTAEFPAEKNECQIIWIISMKMCSRRSNQMQ